MVSGWARRPRKVSIDCLTGALAVSNHNKSTMSTLARRGTRAGACARGSSEGAAGGTMGAATGVCVGVATTPAGAPAAHGLVSRGGEGVASGVSAGGCRGISGAPGGGGTLCGTGTGRATSAGGVGTGAVTADTAARLAWYFGGDAASWLVMQANFDLKTLPTRRDIERSVKVREQLAA